MVPELCRFTDGSLSVISTLWSGVALRPVGVMLAKPSDQVLALGSISGGGVKGSLANKDPSSSSPTPPTATPAPSPISVAEPAHYTLR